MGPLILPVLGGSTALARLCGHARLLQSSTAAPMTLIHLLWIWKCGKSRRRSKLMESAVRSVYMIQSSLSSDHHFYLPLARWWDFRPLFKTRADRYRAYMVILIGRLFATCAIRLTSDILCPQGLLVRISRCVFKELKLIFAHRPTKWQRTRHLLPSYSSEERRDCISGPPVDTELCQQHYFLVCLLFLRLSYISLTTRGCLAWEVSRL